MFSILVYCGSVTNYHKFNGIKQKTFILSVLKARSQIRFLGLKSWCWEGCTPWGGSKVESVPFLFQRLVAASILYLVATSLLSLCFCPHHPLSVSDLHLLLSLHQQKLPFKATFTRLQKSGPGIFGWVLLRCINNVEEE